ncbi:hypothetical protein FNV43_RR08839 [Rhamnella rubrinervis]|uniref:Uncharacterized protein n=1 Tax=Rhamnella rubrinervis TaxID=2594499 RepID=A0A8K0H9N1_9ROSA|nr:hypothetical protein FNV43_RR08839 [Rhamnella rubrinervis]
MPRAVPTSSRDAQSILASSKDAQSVSTNFRDPQSISTSFRCLECLNQLYGLPKHPNQVHQPRLSMANTREARDAYTAMLMP